MMINNLNKTDTYWCMVLMFSINKIKYKCILTKVFLILPFKQNW